MAITALIDLMLPRLLAASVQGSLLVALVWALCRALPRRRSRCRCCPRSNRWSPRPPTS